MIGMNVMEEHINTSESHYSDTCPGPEECACAAGLERILAELRSGRATFVPTPPGSSSAGARESF